MTFRCIDHSSPTDVRVTIDNVTLPTAPPAPAVAPYDDTKLRAHVEMLHSEIFQLRVQNPYEGMPMECVHEPFDYSWLSDQLCEFKGVFAGVREERDLLIAAIREFMQVPPSPEAEAEETSLFLDPKYLLIVILPQYLSAMALITIATLLMLKYV